MFFLERMAHSSSVSAASYLPCRLYRAPRFFSVVVTVGLQAKTSIVCSDDDKWGHLGHHEGGISDFSALFLGCIFWTCSGQDISEADSNQLRRKLNCERTNNANMQKHIYWLKARFVLVSLLQAMPVFHEVALSPTAFSPRISSKPLILTCPLLQPCANLRTRRMERCLWIFPATTKVQTNIWNLSWCHEWSRISAVPRVLVGEMGSTSQPQPHNNPSLCRKKLKASEHSARKSQMENGTNRRYVSEKRTPGNLLCQRHNPNPPIFEQRDFGQIGVTSCHWNSSEQNSFFTFHFSLYHHIVILLNRGNVKVSEKNAHKPYLPCHFHAK